MADEVNEQPPTGFLLSPADTRNVLARDRQGVRQRGHQREEHRERRIEAESRVHSRNARAREPLRDVINNAPTGPYLIADTGEQTGPF